MERHEIHGRSRRGDVLDTIAFGSMLVFASVMPPLDPGADEMDARRACQRRDGAVGFASIEPASGELSARRARRCFDS